MEGYSEIGTLLLAARRDMRMSMDQASHLLHIRVRYLEALEQGRLHELPGLPYARGYLQAYAGFLGLDKDEIVRRFEEIEARLAQKTIYFPQVFSKEKKPNHHIIWGGLACAMIVYTLWAVLGHMHSPSVSLVDAAPGSAGSHQPLVAACFQSQDGLYPPCTMGKDDFALLPLRQLQPLLDSLPVMKSAPAEETSEEAEAPEEL